MPTWMWGYVVVIDWFLHLTALGDEINDGGASGTRGLKKAMFHPSIVRCIDIETEEPSHKFQCPRARPLIIYCTTFLTTT